MVVARAWCRVDLAGGTLDLRPPGLLHPGDRTVSVAIDVAATVRLARADRYRVRQGGAPESPETPENVVEAASAAELVRHPDAALVGVVAEALELPPFAADLATGSPRGGGLGGSSALAVALIAAAEEELDLPRRTPRERVHLARDLEARLMGLPTGIQDHYPALLGGALAIEHLPGGERVRRLDADLDRLGESLLVAYSGQSHFSAGKNWQVVRRRLERDEEIVALFAGIAGAAAALPAALEAGDLERVGALMAEEWGFRRRLGGGVSAAV